jgi:hypothetical protein
MTALLDDFLKNCFIQGVSGGLVNILGGVASIIVREKKVVMNNCLSLNGYRERSLWLFAPYILQT